MWNVRILLENQANLSPELKTALIVRELLKYQIDIAVTGETHLTDSRELCEVHGGYTYFWIKKPARETASSGVGFAIKSTISS